MQKINLFAKSGVVALLALLALLALPPVCRAGETVRINGSGSALDLMKPMLAAYQRLDKDVQFVMEKPLGSSGAMKALLAGALDLVLSSKQLKPEDAARGGQQTVYGATPLVLIAEKKVPRKDLTTRELEDIYSGRLTAWSDGEKIRLVLRPHEDIDSKILSDLSPGMAQAMTAARARTGMIVAVTDPEASATVAKTAGALGASGLTSIIAEKLPVTALTLNGVKASAKNLAKGSYPLSKAIILVTGPKTPPAAQRLVRFMLSREGRAIAAQTGVVVTAKEK